MIYKNLMRRKTRTILTIVGIAVGVAAIVSLGALANGFQAGYTSMLSGSKADLVLSQPNTYDISVSSLDENLDAEIRAMPEVEAVSSMIQGYSQAENEPFFFVFGYPVNSFVLERYQIKKGVSLNDPETRQTRGRPLILGSAAAEILKKDVGDMVRLTNTAFRVVGIYETGDAMEDAGAVISLKDAQELLGKPRQVSLFYIKLKDSKLKERFIHRIERRFSDLSISGMKEFADKQSMQDMFQAYVWVISGLAIVIGGVGMMNSQLMSVYERTREIGVLRAMGWSRIRVLWMIFGEALVVCLGGGVLGSIMGYGLIFWLSKTTTFFGVSTSSVEPRIFITAFSVVILLGMVGGLYPAYRASKLLPVEALRYEGGSSGSKIRRLPFGGMTIQSLWQRATRTSLTMVAIGITVGGIMALEAMIRGVFKSMDEMLLGSKAEIMIRQDNISDTSFSAIDERIAEKIAVMPEVEAVSGMIFTAIVMPEAGGFFVVQGYAPNEFGISRIKVVEGSTLTTNHQIIIGRIMAEALKKKIGDTIELSGTRFRITGIYESNVSWEQMGGVITLRDAQTLTGRPHKVTMLAVKLKDPNTAESVVEKINRQFPEVHATLSAEFSEQMPDAKSSQAMLNAMSFLAIFVGGVGVLNTMLMAVFERTREIGVLRALGWRRRTIMNMIFKESLILGAAGGVVGIIIALMLGILLGKAAIFGMDLDVVWEADIFVRAIILALGLGAVGGIYPSYRATKLQPVEALRYE
jgi:ABC-type antimicrobial peptide transport system permease subunit